LPVSFSGDGLYLISAEFSGGRPNLQYAPDGARIVQTDTACDAPDRQYLVLKNGERISPPPLE
jgi:hypothetical protein